MLKGTWPCCCCPQTCRPRPQSPAKPFTPLWAIPWWVCFSCANATTWGWHHTLLTLAQQPPLSPTCTSSVWAPHGSHRAQEQWHSEQTQTLPGSHPYPPFALILHRSSRVGCSAVPWHSSLSPASAPQHLLHLLPDRLFPHISHELAPLCHLGLSCVSLPQWSFSRAPGHPASSSPLRLTGVSLTFCLTAFTALFGPTGNHLINLFTTLLSLSFNMNINSRIMGLLRLWP